MLRIRGGLRNIKGKGGSVFYTTPLIQQRSFGVSASKRRIVLTVPIEGQERFDDRGAKMLTATYSLVALSVEQEKAQSGLCALDEFIRKNSADPLQASPDVLEAALNELARFDQYYHERKVEIFIIPALR
ncbi:MAG: hypothetical protein ACO1N5_10725, partial [Noviherbaspirillum sp.]